MTHYAGPEACNTQDATRDATLDHAAVNCPECLSRMFRAAVPRPSGRGNLAEMGVTVTLVFADEAHREAWLTRMGHLDDEGKRLDYVQRRQAQNLTFLVGPEIAGSPE